MSSARLREIRSAQAQSAAKVRGLARADALIDALAVAAQHELYDEVIRIGRDVLGRQRDVVARKTGFLAGQLAIEERSDGKVGVNVGLVGLKTKYSRKSRGFIHGGETHRALSDAYYGRFVELGRIAQTIVVTRHIKKRRVKGNGRYGTKRRVIYDTAKKRKRPGKSPNAGTFVGDPYKLRVKAMAARPYIRPPGAREAADRRLADFWARTFSRTGTGS